MCEVGLVSIRVLVSRLWVVDKDHELNYGIGRDTNAKISTSTTVTQTGPGIESQRSNAT